MNIIHVAVYSEFAQQACAVLCVNCDSCALVTCGLRRDVKARALARILQSTPFHVELDCATLTRGEQKPGGFHQGEV